jgi:hypothetical protein
MLLLGRRSEPMLKINEIKNRHEQVMRNLAQDQELPLAKARLAANWIAELSQQLALHLEACGTDEARKFNVIADFDDMRREAVTVEGVSWCLHSIYGAHKLRASLRRC